MAYPAEFRRHCGAEMQRCVRQQAQHEITHGGLPRLFAFTVRLGCDWFTTVLDQLLTPSGKDNVMRIVIAALCVFTAAAASWLVVMETMLRHPGFEQRIVVASLIALQSLLTLAVTRGLFGYNLRIAAGIGAAALFLVGLQAMRATLTGPHFEGFALVIGAALVLQGTMTLWMMLRGGLQRSLT
jgi:hypothetical protein